MTENLQDKTRVEESVDAEIVDGLESLSDEQKEDVISSLEMYRGPIPHPRILAEFEKLDPGAAKLIIDNGVEESSHRRRLESDRSKKKLQMAFVLIIGYYILLFAFMAASFWLVLNNHPVVGGISGSLSFLGLFGVIANTVEVLTKKDDISSEE